MFNSLAEIRASLAEDFENFYIYEKNGKFAAFREDDPREELPKSGWTFVEKFIAA